MKISVNDKPQSKTESIVLNDDGSLTIKLRSLPIEGKANIQLIEMLSTYFKKPKSKIELLKGHKSKKKVFEIKD